MGEATGIVEQEDSQKKQIGRIEGPEFLHIENVWMKLQGYPAHFHAQFGPAGQLIV